MIWRRWSWNEILNAKLKMLNADDQKLKANVIPKCPFPPIFINKKQKNEDICYKIVKKV